MLSRTISGAKLRRVRENKCLKVADLAAAAGCSIWQIYKIEQGKAQPSPELYSRIKKCLRAPHAALIKDSPADDRPVGAA